MQGSIRETKLLYLNIQIIQRDKHRWTEHDQSSLPIYRFMLFLETVLEKSRRCSVDFLATEDSLVTAVTGSGLGSERALKQAVLDHISGPWRTPTQIDGGPRHEMTSWACGTCEGSK